MYVCMYIYFRAIQDGGARGLHFTRLAIIYVPFCRLSIMRNLDISMCLPGITSKKPIERLSCEI